MLWSEDLSEVFVLLVQRGTSRSDPSITRTTSTKIIDIDYAAYLLV